MKTWVVLAVVIVAPLCASAAATGGNSSPSNVVLFDENNAITSLDGKMASNHPIDKPVTSSGPPAAPVPPAGWVGLVGLLGVIALRWFSLARRSAARSIED